MKFVFINKMFISAVFSVLIIFVSYSNKQDSIKYLIRSTEDNKIKVQLLNSLSITYLESNYEEAIKIAYEALSLAKMDDYQDGIICAHRIIGYSYLHNNNYTKALENYFLTIKYLNRTSNHKELSAIYSNISYVYNLLENPKKAILYNKQCLFHLNKRMDYDVLATYYYNYADSYRMLKDHDKELNFLYKCIEIRKRNQQYDKLGIDYISLGYAYWSLQKYDSALDCYNSYLALSIQLKDTLGIARAHMNIGSTYYSQGEYLKSAEYLKKGLSLKQVKIQAHSYLELVHRYCKLNDMKNATYYFNLASCSNADLKELSKACDAVITAYSEKNDTKSLIFYLQASNDIKNNLYLSSKKDLELTAKTQYEAEGMEARMYEKAHKDLLKENLQLQSQYNNILAFVVMLLLIIVVGVVYIYRRSSLKHKKKLHDIKETTLAMGELLFHKTRRVV